jgi:hypothetical protein
VSRPYSRIEHISRVLWLSRFDWSNNVAMFSAHFDESGTPDGNHTVLTVAGCVSSVKKWERFEVQWNKILKEAGLPEGTIFHMNKFARNIRPFQDFENRPERKAALMAALVDCARRNVHRAFACTVVLQDWERLNREYCIVERLGYPYSFCGRTCVSGVLAWARKSDRVPVEFFFERGARHWGHLKRDLKTIDNIEAMDRSKEQMIQFQVADLIAWKSHKLMTDAARYDGPGDRGLYESIQRSLTGINSIPHKYGVHTYETIEALVKRAGVPRRGKH